jgi:predicted transcriptional regulator
MLKMVLILPFIEADAKDLTETISNSSSSNKRRNRTEIVIQILEAVIDCGENGDGTTKTTLMYEVFLDSNQLKEYLSGLTAYSLLYYDPAMRTYNSTKKGLQFLELWYNLSQITNELPRPPPQRLRKWR